MSLPVFAIRPEPGCSQTVAAGRSAGLVIEPCPLFDMHPLAWDPPRAERIDGLLLGSANAVRHGGAALDEFRYKPVYAVGPATASAAQAAGFKVASTGQGGLEGVLYEMSGPLRLLRPTGFEHVTLVPPAGIEIETRVVYEARPLPLSAGVAARLSKGALVLLHSALAARHLAEECRRHGIVRAAVAVAALGPRIAAAAGPGWRLVRSAAEPREPVLLALAHEMCHDLARG